MSSAGSPREIGRYYSSRLAAHGDTAQGAGWPNEADRRTRFAVMAGLAREHIGSARLCDVACGTGAFLDYLKVTGEAPADYLGIDICPDAVAIARSKHPDVQFECRDLLAGDGPALNEPADFVVMNGLFTVRAEVDADRMWAFLLAMLNRLWPVTRQGLAFNVMSDVVEWRRNDLFHVPMDRLAKHLFDLAGRRVVFRNDYDLFEYTVYLYRDSPGQRVGRG